MSINRNGIDVPAWQGDIAWDKVKKAGYSTGNSVSLSGTPIFAATTAEKQISHFSGQYWICDGLCGSGCDGCAE